MDKAFLGRVRELRVHERAVLAPPRTHWESTRIFSSLESLLAFLEKAPLNVELEVARKRDRYIVYIRE